MPPRVPLATLPLTGVLALGLFLTTWSAVPTTALAVPPAWEEIGPAPILYGEGGYSGRLSAVVCSRTDWNKYYVAGADGGVWRTTDGGSTWTPLTDAMPTTAMGALAMDPTDENTLYAGSGEANFANHSRYGLGLYRTTDGGQTWVQLAEGAFAGRCFSRILVDPLNPAILWAGVTRAGGFPEGVAARGHPQAWGQVGVFKSTDHGAAWTQVTTGLPALSATDLVLDPTNPQILYAAIGHIFGHADNGIYKSTDGGAGWTKLAGGLPTSNVGRISLAIAPSNPAVLYTIYTNAASASGGNATTINVYKTINGGTTWTALDPSNFQATYGWYLSTVIVHPTNPNTVIVGGLDLLRNTGGGWTDVTPLHVDMHALAWDAAGRLLVGNDGVLHRSADLGSTWTSHNYNLGCIQFYAGLSLSPASPFYVYGGTQDNGTNFRTADSPAWTQTLSGDGGYTGVRPAHPEIVFGEYQGTGNLYRFTSYGLGGYTYSGSGISTSDRNCFLPPYAINSLNDAQMLYGTHRVYYSANAGTSWTARSGDLTTGTGAIRCLILAPSNPQTVYVVTNDGNVQISTNFGTNWTLSRTGVPGWPRTTRQIAVDPNDDQRALLGVSNFGVEQVLLTTNRGASWTAIDGDLPDVPVNTVAIVPRTGRNIFYAGTDTGVYASANGGLNWALVGNLPHTAVIDLIYDAAHGRLLAGTQGRGAWFLPLLSAGDFNADNDVDLGDYAAFAGCLFGPGVPPSPAPPLTASDCLAVFDFNADGDVDLGDFTAFQAAFTGS